MIFLHGGSLLKYLPLNSVHAESTWWTLVLWLGIYCSKDALTWFSTLPCLRIHRAILEPFREAIDIRIRIRIHLFGPQVFVCIWHIVARSTQRVQTSLAEADHYSHRPTVKMLSLGGERQTPPPPKKKKKKKKVLPAPWSGYAIAVMAFFAHLLTLEYADNH